MSNRDMMYGLVPNDFSPSDEIIKNIKPRDLDQEAAKKFIDGLRTQVARRSADLKENQEVAMYCWHGHEHLRVISISMPSHNVVAMHCVDANDCPTDVTGHIHSISFSIKVHTIVPPATKTPIGFEMPLK
jgi:hypothetical protein